MKRLSLEVSPRKKKITIKTNVMKKNNKTKKYPKQPIWRGFAGFLRIFFKRPEIINLAGELPKKAIYVANHSAMAGPVIYNLYFPADVSPWGAHQMLEGYRQRFKYLRDVYFVQKRGMNKAAASFIAFFEAFFSIWIYKGMKVIPSYPDGRMLKTIRLSMQTLDANRSVIIFPENSEQGYSEVLSSFWAGFVTLAERYAKVNGQEIPIVPVYYHKKTAKMVIGKPRTLSEFKRRGLNRSEIAKEFCAIVNGLCTEHILKKQTTADDVTELEPIKN